MVNVQRYGASGTAYRNAAVAQSVERRIGSAEVTGPIPVSSFIKKTFQGKELRKVFLF